MRGLWLATALFVGCAAPAAQPTAAPPVERVEAPVAPEPAANGALRVVMYGSSRCGICHGFRARMDRQQLPYSFVDVRADPQGQRTMWALVRRARPGANRVRFPVITIGDQILVSPRYADFQAAYDKATR